jgi:hypothetical protein
MSSSVSFSTPMRLTIVTGLSVPIATFVGVINLWVLLVVVFFFFSCFVLLFSLGFCVHADVCCYFLVGFEKG